MKAAALSLLIILLFGCSQSGVSVSDLRDGDLLFVVSGDGNNITNVTDGVYGLGIDHVAIYSEDTVLEAIPVKGVVKWPLDSFLIRLAVNDAVLVGRVGGLDARRSVENAVRFVGLPYDDIFMPGDSAIYCSELIQKSYQFRGGESVFGTIPMSFHDSTGRVTDFWTKFYAARGLSVPEGEPGTNPGQISRDPNVRILGLLGGSTSSPTVH